MTICGCLVIAFNARHSLSLSLSRKQVPGCSPAAFDAMIRSSKAYTDDNAMGQWGIRSLWERVQASVFDLSPQCQVS